MWTVYCNQNVMYWRQFLKVAQLHTCINYQDCLRGCQGAWVLTLTKWSGWFVWIRCWLIHVGVKMCLPCKSSHISLPLCTDTNKMPFDLGRRSSVTHCAWKPQNYWTPFAMHLMLNISISLCLLPVREDAQTLAVGGSMPKLCFFLIYLQYPLHRGCSALDGEYHNDVIHMQPGLGNPSNAETKP